jgi:hypothetical protein
MNRLCNLVVRTQGVSRYEEIDPFVYLMALLFR